MTTDLVLDFIYDALDSYSVAGPEGCADVIQETGPMDRDTRTITLLDDFGVKWYLKVDREPGPPS